LAPLRGEANTGVLPPSLIPIDTLTLTLPNARPYFGVARLVLGGLAARLGLGYEQMDDLQLAVETVLAECNPPGETVTLEATIGESLAVTIGPLSSAAGGPSATVASGRLSFPRLLEKLVEETAIVERDDEVWLRLQKRLPSGRR
jgi:hypothetical protein